MTKLLSMQMVLTEKKKKKKVCKWYIYFAE